MHVISEQTLNLIVLKIYQFYKHVDLNNPDIHTLKQNLIDIDNSPVKYLHNIKI